MPTSALASYGKRLATALLEVPETTLVGVYLHGSAVLGGFAPHSSDVDVLAVIAEPADAATRARIRDTLIAAANPCPGTGLEMSVITATTAAELGDCRFEAHVAVAGDEVASSLGGEGGDPDLILYAEVCRRHGWAVYGPPAQEIFGPVPPDRLRHAMLQEVRWGLANSHLSYAVLNACRAVRFATDGVFCSKLAAGEWALAGGLGGPVVTVALAQQRAGEKRPVTGEAARFVAQMADRLQRMIEPGNR